MLPAGCLLHRLAAAETARLGDAAAAEDCTAEVMRCLQHQNSSSNSSRADGMPVVLLLVHWAPEMLRALAQVPGCDAFLHPVVAERMCVSSERE